MKLDEVRKEYHSRLELLRAHINHNNMKRIFDEIRQFLNKLTLSAPIPDEEKKLAYTFIFTLLCGASKGFRKALKAFIKPSEAPQRSVKI